MDFHLFRRIFLGGLIVLMLIACNGDSETPPSSEPEQEEQDTIITAEDLFLEIEEHPPVGFLLGVINASVNQGNLSYSISSEDPSGAVHIDSDTGEIVVGEGDLFEYDENPIIVVIVLVTSGAESVEVEVTINLIETEEIFVHVENLEINVDENLESGQLLGQIEVETNATEVLYSLENVQPEGAIEIDVETGKLSVLDKTLFDYETNPQITAIVQITGDEVVSSADLIILLNDLDDSPPEGAIFTGRTYMEAIEFNGRLFVIGGWDGTQNTEVWVSDNGFDWEYLSNYGVVGTAGIHVQVIEFQNRLWVITAGSGSTYLSEIWSSTDGITWVQESPTGDFFGLTDIQIVMFNGKLYAIGGIPEADAGIWSSTDGVTWIKETSSGVDFGGLTTFDATVFANQIFVVGGYKSGVGANNDVWSSLDGVNWTKVNSEGTKFKASTGHQVVTFNNRIWVIGGISSDNEYLNEIWSSSDGENWTQEYLESAQFSPRAYHAATVFNSSIWVIGGRYLSEPRLNDIYRLD